MRAVAVRPPCVSFRMWTPFGRAAEVERAEEVRPAASHWKSATGCVHDVTPDGAGDHSQDSWTWPWRRVREDPESAVEHREVRECRTW